MTNKNNVYYNDLNKCQPIGQQHNCVNINPDSIAKHKYDEVCLCMGTKRYMMQIRGRKHDQHQWYYNFKNRQREQLTNSSAHVRNWEIANIDNATIQHRKEQALTQ